MMRIIRTAREAIKKEVDEIKNVIKNLTTALINFTNVMNAHKKNEEMSALREEEIIEKLDMVTKGLDAQTKANEQLKSVMTSFFIQGKKFEISREKDRLKKEKDERPSPDDLVF